MLLPLDLKIHLATAPVDMCKSYQILGILVKNVLGRDPFCGHLFVFYNKCKDLVKILYWQKKLEKGVFILLHASSGHSLEISSYHLPGFIQGLDCWKVKMVKELCYQQLS
jgi:transposase